MKKKILLILFVCISVMIFVLPACAGMKNENDNFRGVPWRLAPPQSRKNQWELVETMPFAGPFNRVYERKKEKLQLGGAKIDSVYYFFHRDLGFAMVEISASGKENYELMRKACIENWGKPNKDDNLINQGYKVDKQETKWVGQRLTAELACFRSVNYYTTLVIHLNEYWKYVRKYHEEELQREKGF